MCAPNKTRVIYLMVRLVICVCLFDVLSMFRFLLYFSHWQMFPLYFYRFIAAKLQYTVNCYRTLNYFLSFVIFHQKQDRCTQKR